MENSLSVFFTIVFAIFYSYLLAYLITTTYSTYQVKTFYYEQTLDHFNYRPESYITFRQRYMINAKFWGGANSSAPIFACLGAEQSIDYYPDTIGFLTSNAASFKALLVYIEHRYYGKSIPFGSRVEAFKNASTLGYFNSEQALADYAEILLYIKRRFDANKSPVIVIGGSYGGMLATWFRLKYPHVTIGALASSAPILYFDNITPQSAYHDVVTRDFRDASETCYQTISKSWPEIDRVASQPNGLSVLSQQFKSCQPLSTSSELKNYLEYVYVHAAQYNRPPQYPVTMICRGIDGAPIERGILGKIVAGLVAFHGDNACKVKPVSTYVSTSDETLEGWQWQDIKSVLEKFGSNIIFSNGLKDPFSSGGVLHNISNSIVAVYTVNGSHCLDILPAKGSDPKWLIEQREKEVEIIKGWITRYYIDIGEPGLASIF